MIGKRGSNNFEWGIRWRACVNQVTAVRNCRRQAGKRADYQLVVWKQFIQAGNDANVRPRRYARQRLGIECIAFLEPSERVKAFLLDQRLTLVDVDLAVIAQQ